MTSEGTFCRNGPEDGSGRQPDGNALASALSNNVCNPETEMSMRYKQNRLFPAVEAAFFHDVRLLDISENQDQLVKCHRRVVYSYSNLLFG